MYYRLLQVSFAPEKLDELLNYMESIRDEYSKAPGLVSNTLVQTEPGSVTAVVIYEEEPASETSAAANKVIGGLASMISGPPVIIEGDSIWELVA